MTSLGIHPETGGDIHLGTPDELETETGIYLGFGDELKEMETSPYPGGRFSNLVEDRQGEHSVWKGVHLGGEECHQTTSSQERFSS